MFDRSINLAARRAPAVFNLVPIIVIKFIDLSTNRLMHRRHRFYNAYK